MIDIMERLVEGCDNVLTGNSVMTSYKALSKDTQSRNHAPKRLSPRKRRYSHPIFSSTVLNEDPSRTHYSEPRASSTINREVYCIRPRIMLDTSTTPIKKGSPRIESYQPIATSTFIENASGETRKSNTTSRRKNSRRSSVSHPLASSTFIGDTGPNGVGSISVRNQSELYLAASDMRSCPSSSGLQKDLHDTHSVSQMPRSSTRLSLYNHYHPASTSCNRSGRNEQDNVYLSQERPIVPDKENVLYNCDPAIHLERPEVPGKEDPPAAITSVTIRKTNRPRFLRNKGTSDLHKSVSSESTKSRYRERATKKMKRLHREFIESERLFNCDTLVIL